MRNLEAQKFLLLRQMESTTYGYIQWNALPAQPYK
ncbi:hypothetical protein L950_0222545 [Sphingobacterium sp. IITKGP-BTPF85]|nr:hypothetical protein L950_0222545 [Sphingobacterium sp. IITKGP-BTPF85]